VLIYNAAAISGGHLNPAVTLGLAIAQQIPPLKMVAYWISQFLGGFAGAAMYTEFNLDAKGAKAPGCTVPGNTGLTAGNIFGLEFIATFLLVFTVFATAVDPQSGAGNFAPIAIGFTLFVAAMTVGPYTGAGLNPARTLCPAVVHNCWENDNGGDNYQWAYVLAQFLAGAFAALLYKYAFLTRPGDGQKKASSAFQFMALESEAIRRRLTQDKKSD